MKVLIASTLIACSFVLWAGAASSEIPAIPEDAVPVMRAPCSDNETGAVGICELYAQPLGDMWMLFLQDGHPVFLRYVPQGEPYMEAWRATEPTF